MIIEIVITEDDSWIDLNPDRIGWIFKGAANWEKIIRKYRRE